MSRANKKNWDDKTDNEKEEISNKMKKEKNPNWKGGKTFFTCPTCGKVTRIGGENIDRKTCIDCRSYDGERNPFYGKTHSKETLEKIKETKSKWSEEKKKEIQEKCRLASYKKARSVSVEGVIYESMYFCQTALSLHPNTIRYRIKSKNFPTYFYVD